MDMISIRRKLMAKMQSGGLDTSPRIEEYGKYLGRGATTISIGSDYCYTEWYDIDPLQTVDNRLQIYNCGIDTTHVYQYVMTGGQQDWDYRIREGFYVLPASVNKIRFSIVIANLSDCYAYIDTSGQVLFAGRNTPYWGKTNIND